MKKSTIISLILILFVSVGHSQNKKTKKMLKEIEGQWKLDDQNNLTYIKIVEANNLTKDEIYNRALNYFVYNYGSGKSVIQTKDKEQGLIVGKGLYKNVHIGQSLITTYVSCWHILRVDVKEGRARILLTLTQYDKKVTGGDGPPKYTTLDVNREFPINRKGYFKTVMGKSFYKSHKQAQYTLAEVEKSIIEGNTSSSIENSDW